MKIILLFSLLLTSLLANQTQIVLGTYSKHASAKNTQLQLNKTIEKDLKFNNAYVSNTMKTTTTKNENENIIDKFFNVIIAFLVILVLSIIYLITRKNKHKNEQDETNLIKEEVPLKVKKTEIKKEVPLKIETLSNNDSEKQNNDDTPIIMQETDEINFDAVKEPPLTSSTIKKEVKSHGKRRKDDFKDFNGSRIMIAEDNLINQKVVSGLLSTSGIQMKIVNDGLEAIEYLKNDDDFCIILMDANMPNMDGYEATKIIRQNEKYNHITVIALSGDTASDDIRKMKNAGMQEHLEKPLKMSSLYDMLAAFSFKRRDGVDLNEDINIQKQQELFVDTGIEVCGGDENFYKEILNDFLDNYSNSTSKLQNFLNNNQFLEASQLLLDIAGVTANIGALNLQKSVKDLRLKLKDHEDKSYIQIFKKYAKHYQELENEIKEYLAK